MTEDAANIVQAGETVGDWNRIAREYWDGEHPVVEYTVLYRGIVPSSGYYGIFYSPDDVPVCFQNT